MNETESVLLANDNFYRALSLADLGAMTRAWLASPDAACLHPGGPSLQGWPAIRESWASIFTHQGPLRVWATEASARLYGETAEVTCLENIDAGRVSGVLQTRATNIFRRVNGEWKMLEHQAVSVASSKSRGPEQFSAN